MITKISNREMPSESKVVGILVEEELIVREVLDTKKKITLIRKNHYVKGNKFNELSIEYNDIDELISDRGITCDRIKSTLNSGNDLSKRTDNYNNKLFEEFKQFILFKK